MGDRIPGSNSSDATWAQLRVGKGCRSTKASPHEDATGCDGRRSQPNGTHRGCRRVKAHNGRENMRDWIPGSKSIEATWAGLRGVKGYRSTGRMAQGAWEGEV